MFSKTCSCSSVKVNRCLDNYAYQRSDETTGLSPKDANQNQQGTSLVCKLRVLLANRLVDVLSINETRLHNSVETE